VDGVEPLIDQMPSSPGPAVRELNRSYPLVSPRLDFSPGPSPPTSPYAQFSSFSFPADDRETTTDQDAPPPPRVSRMTHAKRRASVFQSRMSSTVASVWSRAIGRAHGSVSLATSIRDVTITLPYPSGDKAAPETPSPIDITHKGSAKPLNGETRAKSFRSVGSFHSILHKLSRPAVTITHGDSEQLASLEGTSQAFLHLGFGPKKGLLGEDTLRTKVQLGKFVTSLNAAEKLQAISKAHKKPAKESSNSKPRARWSTKSLPRVCSTPPRLANRRSFFAHSSLSRSRSNSSSSRTSYRPSHHLPCPPRPPSPTCRISFPRVITSASRSTHSPSFARSMRPTHPRISALGTPLVPTHRQSQR